MTTVGNSGMMDGLLHSLAIGDVTALLQNMLENAAVPTFLARADGSVMYANSAYTALLGFEPEECVGLGVRSVVHPDDSADAMQQMADIAAGRTDVYRGERRYIRKDGSPVWVLVSAAAIRDKKTGEAICFAVQAVDIDRQKRAEAEISAHEQRWNLALAGTGQGVWDRNLRTGEDFFSSMWKQMRGFVPGDNSHRTWPERVHPEDWPRVRALIDKQFAGELHYTTFEYRERHEDGHWIWIQSRGRTIETFPDGRPARIIGTDSDITALKATEAQLAEEKERLRVTLGSIGDGVISTDAAGTITFLNAAAEQMTGWAAKHAVGCPVETVFSIACEQTGEPMPNPVRECLARRETYRQTQDAVLVGRGGERRSVRETAAPVRTRDGDLIGAVLVFHDVTASRALQRELAHSAMHDSLTDLLNRKAFEAALMQAASDRRSGALCFIDLDRFKQVNDTAGHSAGDALLRKIGEVIHAAAGHDNIAGRIGGDEFALLIRDCTVDEALHFAEEVVANIAAIRFFWEGVVFQVGASIGVAVVDGSQGDARELMHQADTACYAAKAKGRNRVTLYDAAQSAPRRFAISA